VNIHPLEQKSPVLPGGSGQALLLHTVPAARWTPTQSLRETAPFTVLGELDLGCKLHQSQSG